MTPRPEDQNEQTEHTDQTEAIPQEADDTARIDALDTARMPSAAEVPAAPPAVGAPQWAAAVDGAAGVAPAGPPAPAPASVPVAAAAPAKSSPWWKGRLALAGGALAAGLLLGGAVGATTAVAIDGSDTVTQVTEGGRGGFDGEGRPPGGRHGGGMGELPEGQGQLPGGGQGQLPGGGTSTDPNDANGTNEST